MDVRRVVIMAVLLLALVWALMTSPLTKRFRGGTPARVSVPPGALSTDADQPVIAQPTAGTKLAPGTPLAKDELTRWREHYATAWRRDPFFTGAEEKAMLAPKTAATQAKAAAPPAPLPSYTVKAILISDAGKVATLDGRLVSEGEPIGEERVVEIRQDGVILERAGQRRRIGLPGGATTITEESRARGGPPSR